MAEHHVTQWVPAWMRRGRGCQAILLNPGLSERLDTRIRLCTRFDGRFKCPFPVYFVAVVAVVVLLFCQLSNFLCSAKKFPLAAAPQQYLP